MNIRSFLLASAVFLSATTAALAGEIHCAFVSECVETERCAKTDYAATITHKPFAFAADGMDSSAQWVDDAITRSVFLRKRPDIMFAMWAENDGRQFARVMADGDGTARYVVMDSTIPLIITYYGTCEEAE